MRKVLLETNCWKEEINWVTREDTCSTKSSRAEQSRGDPSDNKRWNLKGAIRNRKVQKKAQKRRPQ
jgi:hypothetical protein